MWRTALASLVLALLGGLGAAWVTEGFEVWTAEGARRLQVAQAPVAVPHALLLGDGSTGLALQAMLAVPRQATIVGFIYTRCPGVCLALGSSFQQLQGALAAPGVQGRVRLLSISFDPAHDGAAQLRSYAVLWRADPRHWRMATVPDGAQLQRLLRAWQVVVISDGMGGYEHNAALLVIDARGRLLRIFDDSEGEAALAFALALP